MLGRKYTKQISIHRTSVVSDGFGGNTVTQVVLFNSWAKIDNVGAGFKSKQIGLDNFNTTVIFNVRYRADYNYNALTDFLTYKGKKYIIQAVLNIDLADTELSIYATLENE
jgi:SPP1 family predicted phage head-tail adaptor